MRNFGLSDDDLRALGYTVGGASTRRDEPNAPEGTPGAPPKRRKASPALRIWLATLIVLPLVGWASSMQRRLPDPVPAAGPDASFASARALAQLVELAQRPHPTGSPDLVRVRSALLGRLSALGLEPQVQVTTAHVRDSSFVRAATVRNVVARMPGSGSTGTVALIAHFDAAPLSPGAGDNALGVASVLEAVRAVVSAGPLRNDVVIVLTDGDEVGALGSRAFGRHPWASDVSVTLSVESRGVSGPALLFESLPGNGPLVDGIAAASVGQTGASLARELQGSTVESRAHAAPSPAPFAALTVLGGRAWEDQVRDVRERVDERTLQHMGDQLVVLLRTLGGLDLRSDLDGPRQTYLSVPRLGLVHYPISWSLFVTLGLVLLWGLTGLVIRLRRGTRNGIIAGLAVGAGAVGLTAVASGSLMGIVGGLHPEYGLLETAFYRDAPHILALGALAVVVTTTLYGLGRWWCRWDEILFGALAVPLGFVLWITFVAPSAASAGQWPLALALLGALALTVLGPRRGNSVWAWAVVLVVSAATLALVVPSLELISRAWTLRSATSLGALFALTTLLFVPLLDWLRRPKVWATPLVAGATGAVLIGLYLPGVQGAVDHPEPTTLVYLTDEAAAADPILRGTVDTTGVRTVLGKWLTVPGPGEEWARSWVGNPPTGSTDPGVLLIGSDDLYEIAGTAPDGQMAPPVATVVASDAVGGRREVALEVRSGLRGEMLGFVVPEGSPAELTGVGNASWPVGGVPARQLVHWGVPDGRALRLGLSMPADVRTLDIVVLEHHLRPREVLGDYFFQRGDSIIASARLGSDRAIQRTVLTIDVTAPVPSALDGEQAPGSDEALETPEDPVGE